MRPLILKTFRRKLCWRKKCLSAQLPTYSQLISLFSLDQHLRSNDLTIVLLDQDLRQTDLTVWDEQSQKTFFRWILLPEYSVTIWHLFQTLSSIKCPVSDRTSDYKTCQVNLKLVKYQIMSSETCQVWTNVEMDKNKCFVKCGGVAAFKNSVTGYLSLVYLK